MKQGDPPKRAALPSSAAQAEARHDRAITLNLGLLQVVEEATALPDQQQQPTAAVVVMLVLLEVISQVADPM